MKKKASFCADCVNFSLNAVCAKNHKPRHYMPQSMRDSVNGNYGYKRVCNDFKECKR